jgi:PKD repeat protein
MRLRILLASALFALLYTSSAVAQITLTADDLPPFGLVLQNGQDTLLTDADLGMPSDQPQTWDFTGFEVEETITNTVVMPSQTPNGDQFPTATFAFEGDDDFYSYAELRDDALLALGGSTVFPDGSVVTLGFDPPQQLLTVPATYGSSFSAPFRFEIVVDGSGFGVDSVRVISSGTASGEIDAFGEVTVPAGTFPALRQRNETVRTDSVFILLFGNFVFIDATQETTVSYEWWGQDGVGTICTVEVDESDTPLSAIFLTDVQAPSSAPVAGFTFEEQQQGEFQFTDASTMNPTSWAWDFGDGNTSMDQNPLHTFEAPGLYTVCMTVSNADGTDTACQEVAVTFAPQASFTIEVLTDSSFQFMDMSTNTPTSWAWDFGDGNTSDEQNPTHTFAETGDYNVCLTASNSAGSDESCVTVQVIIVNTGELTLTAPELTVFPSPAQDWVSVQLDGLATKQAVELRVHNALGQQLLQQRFDQSPEAYSFQVADWQAGIYFLTVWVEGERLVQAFSVQ